MPVDAPPPNNLYIRTVMLVGGVNELMGPAIELGSMVLQSTMISKGIMYLKRVPCIMHLPFMAGG